MTFTFFSLVVRYVSTCGQEVDDQQQQGGGGVCPSELQTAWSVLQSVCAFVLWVSCALIGVRARQGGGAIVPAIIVLFFLISEVTHAIALANSSWTLGFYAEIYCWAGAVVAALLFFVFDVIRVPLASFTLLSFVGGVCQIVELAKPGAVREVSTAGLGAITGSAILVGGVTGAFLESKGIRKLGILAGSIGQAFVVTPLVFAACNFDGCRVLWRLRECHHDSQMRALAVTVSTFIGSCVVGLIVQCCWAYRDQREEAQHMSSVSLHYHIADMSSHDLVGEDLASRAVLQGQEGVPHLDDRWSRMGSPRD